MKLKKKYNKKRSKTKKITIKRIKTKFNIIITQNQMLKDDIENKIQTTIKRMMTNLI
jgi:hypothetical protein